MSARLSPASRAAAAALARRRGSTAGVIHFGPGAFHRAHQAWYLDKLLDHDPRWAITGVSLQSPDVRNALGPQGGMYVLAELGEQRRFQVIGAVTRLLVAREEREQVLALMAAPYVGWISATVTEKGYCLDGAGELDVRHADIIHDLATPSAPKSLIGYLAEGLRRRRAAGLPPPAIVSCDNLSDNGRLLKRAVVTFASEIDRALGDWIEAEAAFPRTMVDSITPASDDALRALVQSELDVADAWPVQREAFCQWVVEDCLPAGAPDLASVGVEITSDVHGYERAKLRLLNGAHSSLAYLGLLRGHVTVADAMRDVELARLIEVMMRVDIAPLVKAPGHFDVPRYIADVLLRFRNPAIRHQLSQIAWDGSQKLPFRLLETIAEARIAGRAIRRLCMPVAAWMAFVRRQAKAGIAIVDPMRDRLASVGAACVGPALSDVEVFLSLPVFPPGLAADPVFRHEVARCYGDLTGLPPF